MKKWVQFLKERFDPLGHFTMITLFLLGHILLTKSLGLITLAPWQYIALSFAVVFFFLKLRFYDEIKDYETDIHVNPTRPLPRGLITHRDLYQAIALAIVIELFCFGICSAAGLITGLVAIVYSLCMFKEFFIGPVLRPHLTSYAVSHTAVTILLSLSIFSGLTGLMINDLPIDLLLFSLISWLLFNIFEFGRKSYLKNEERENVPTYSNIFGRWGAFGLVFSQALIVIYLMFQIEKFNSTIFKNSLLIIIFLLAILGILFCTAKEGSLYGKIYRGFTSFFIVLIYGATIIYFSI